MTYFQPREFFFKEMERGKKNGKKKLQRNFYKVKLHSLYVFLAHPQSVNVLRLHCMSKYTLPLI